MDDGKKATPDERRHHILDVAHRVFIRDGYAGASMSRIAAEVGGSKTTLYNYFDSKKELFVAVTERETARLFDEVFVVEAKGGDFPARIVEMARRMVGAMLTDDMVESYRLIVAESGRFPEIGITAYQMAIERGMARLSEFFATAMAEGHLRQASPQDAAELFLTLTSGMLHDKRVWNVTVRVDPETITAEARRITAIFLAVFGNDTLSAAARQA